MLNFVISHDFAYLRTTFLLSASNKTSNGQIKSLQSLPQSNRGYFTLKNGLRNPNWPREGLQSAKKIKKHMQRPMTPSWYSTWPLESNLILKIVDSMSNESPKKTLQDAHAYYRNQSPNRWRISVCSSIQAAAVRSWTSKGATPGKASWSLFESV